MSAADVVARQVEAYNAHDLEAFASCYADDVVVTSGAGDVLLSGIAALRQQYGEWFSQMQDLSAEVVQRLTRGAWVVARTRGRPDSLIADAAWRSVRACRVPGGDTDLVAFDRGGTPIRSERWRARLA